MAGSGTSYQKYDGASGTYQQVASSDVDSNNGIAIGGRCKWVILGVGLLVVAGAVAYGVMATENSPLGKGVSKKVTSHVSSSVSIAANGKLKLFDDRNRFVLEDYDAKYTFSSFLPGVGGYFGKPVWAFYVNRAQGIATFGTQSKDYPIMEFNPANKAYQLTPFLGFRTFLKLAGGKSALVEPFSVINTRSLEEGVDESKLPKRIQFVGPNELELQDIDSVSGITTKVQYVVLPEADFAALIRRTTFTNEGPRAVTFEVLDGLARIEPFGGPLDGMLKSMGRTLEGWMGVYHADDTITLPFYKLSTEPSDSASVKIEEAGHYCMAFIESEDAVAELLPIVFDTSKVFGSDTSLEKPKGLVHKTVSDLVAHPQYGWAKTSSAFAAATNITLKPGENITLASIYGKAEHIDQVPRIKNVVTAPGYIKNKFDRARSLIDELTAGVETKTNQPLFDGTVKQMFLDNSLRGGIPTILGNVDSNLTYDEDPGVKVFHTFSRIHGDLERDYNNFLIDTTYFSQGPGNYRDVAQNRRNDVTFFPRIGSFDIQQFLSFIQADGYEPLTVEAVVFRFEDPDVATEVSKKVTADTKSAEVLANVLNGGPFRPGQLFDLCELLQIAINPQMNKADFINAIVEKAQDRAMAQFGQGYWGDHWDYYIDLIENYLAIYPDGEEATMYDTSLRYFFSTASIKPRSKKYVLTLTYDATSYHVQQLDSTYYDQDKAAEQEAFRSVNTGLISIEANWQRTVSGTPYQSSAIAKLFLLGAIKFATRDAYGMGVEYEGGRPGWLDSMNGLPGMIGSGMPETFELLLLLKYVKKVVDAYKRPVVVPLELAKMITTVEKALDKLRASGYKDPKQLTQHVPTELFEYWDITAAARESYRNDVEYYFSGNETTYKANEVSYMVGRWIEEVELGIKRAFYFSTMGDGDDGTSGVAPCFFAYDVTDWKLNNGRNDVGLPLVNALAMKVRKFPQFLEGPVRYMKTIQDDPVKMKDMYQKVLTSGLRDEVLKMYFLSASLKGQSYDMGRQMSFAPGWLENQSIWTHMSYKFYLQLIRGKLYDEFFSEMRGGGMLPFMDPDVYGRPVTECSSFIASSAFPDPSIVGEGFLARLSGSTAEYMDMWRLMFIGPKPFFIAKDGKVEMQFKPTLPSWLFFDENSGLDPVLDNDGSYLVSFKLFAAIRVVYHNPGAQNLYGVAPKSYKVTMKDGKIIKIDGSTIPTETAQVIRRVKTVELIDAYF